MWRDKRQDFCQKAKEIVENAKKNIPQAILDKIPKPDSNPIQRAKRIKDKMDLLEQNDPNYNKKKEQLEKVIYEVLQQLPDKMEAESFYRSICPKDHDDDYAVDDDMDGGFVNNFDDDDENCFVYNIYVGSRACFL